MWGKRTAISWDDLERLRFNLSELQGEVALLTATVNAMGVEWEDIRDQVVRSYKRLEQAERRADMRESGPGRVETPEPVEERTDAWSRKLAAVREQSGAIQSGA